MKKTISTAIVFLVLLMNIPTIHAQLLNIDARSCILIDSKSGQVLYEQNADKRLNPASTTKIMTAIIALEKGDLNGMMTASQAAVDDIGEGGMNIGIMAGEEIRLEDLLNALLISSANETANIIAENICATREEFIGLMNKRARELGAVNTNFVNPCGKHDENHKITAGDLAKIARYAMTLPEFREIVVKKSYNMPVTNKHSEWNILPATNKLLWHTSDYFSRVTGIKSGYTSQAGYNLVSSAINMDGMELIAVVLGVSGIQRNVFNYSMELLEYGFRNYSIRKIADAGQFIKNVPVAGAADNAGLDLVTQNRLDCVLPLDTDKWKLTKKVYIVSPVKAPIKQGDVLGYAEYERNGVILGRTDITASRAIEIRPELKVIGTTKNVVNNLFAKKVISYGLIILSAFIILRSVLRKISRAVRSNRRKINE